jgi:hypothetical protein
MAPTASGRAAIRSPPSAQPAAPATASRRHLRALGRRRGPHGGEQHQPGRGADAQLAGAARERLDRERHADVGEHRHRERGRLVQQAAANAARGQLAH